MTDFLQKLIINGAVDPSAVIESERSIERESLEVRNGIDVHCAILRVVENLLDAHVAFEIENWHV